MTANVRYSRVITPLLLKPLQRELNALNFKMYEQLLTLINHLATYLLVSLDIKTFAQVDGHILCKYQKTEISEVIKNRKTSFLIEFNVPIIV